LSFSYLVRGSTEWMHYASVQIGDRECAVTSVSVWVATAVVVVGVSKSYVCTSRFSRNDLCVSVADQFCGSVDLSMVNHTVTKTVVGVARHADCHRPIVSIRSIYQCVSCFSMRWTELKLSTECVCLAEEVNRALKY